MKIKLLLSTLIGGIIIYSGCGESSYNPSNNSSTNQKIQQLLQNHQYVEVINTLHNKPLTNNDYTALGKAYMGLSGLDIQTVIQKIYASGDGNNSSLMTFINSANYDKVRCDVPLSYLNKATQYFMKVIGDRCTTAPQQLTNFEKNICVYKGLAQTMEAVTTLNYIKNGDDNNTSDSKLRASTCAMQYAFNGSAIECSVLEKGFIHFQQNDRVYQSITVYPYGANREYEFLLKGTKYPKEVIVTHGYCATDDYTTRVDSKEDTSYKSSYHVCPINLNEDITTVNVDHFTTKDFIIDSFNKGTETILQTTTDTKLKQQIQDFRDDIYQTRTKTTQKTQQIDEEDMVQYLKQQTKKETTQW
ncbi:hypothetical protein MNB_SM-3-388 [hydrothermal vent metagenome]|uniref:Uncharacterized protein n=1 Tax=hydrothermal vent metagenome TaxID=652676 RepID=A0A1W1D462_9ZZZZ